MKRALKVILLIIGSFLILCSLGGYLSKDYTSASIVLLIGLFLVFLAVKNKIILKNMKKSKKENHETKEIIFKKCPVCKKGKVQTITEKHLFRNKIKNICDFCNAEFIEQPNEEVTFYNKKGGEEKSYLLDLNNSNVSNKYEGETLRISEWQRGISDLDLCIKENKLPKLNIKGELPILLENGEKTYWYSPARLGEERAVRHTGYVGFRIIKGVYVGGSRGVSHGELRVTDNGVLLLTNKRVIFHGSFKDLTYPLNKISSIQEFSDAIEIGSSNRQKVQTYFVNEPKKWITFIKIALKLKNN